MRAFPLFVAAAVIATAPMSPAIAQDGYGDGWRPPPSYGYDDPCHAARHRAAEHGAVTGGVLGAVAGALLGGGRHRVAGAVVGGAVGAVAGSQIARGQVRCLAYPYGYRPHPGCHWVYDHGRGFEICRGRDGYWRPWDRGY